MEMSNDDTIGNENKRRRSSVQSTSLTSSLISKPKQVWTKEEDEKLNEYINKNGEGNWNQVATFMDSNRTGKQCRERWFNHLSPAINKGEWTEEEDRIIREMRKVVGNQWSLMRKYLVGRSDNAIKNRVNAAERCKGVKVKKQIENTSTIINNNNNNNNNNFAFNEPGQNSILMGEKYGNNTDISVKRFDSNATSMMTDDFDLSLLDDECLNDFMDGDLMDYVDEENVKFNEKDKKEASKSNNWNCDGCSIFTKTVQSMLSPNMKSSSSSTGDGELQKLSEKNDF